MLKIPTSKKLSRVLTKLPARFLPVFAEMFSGAAFGDACHRHNIPRMTCQLHCWIATAAVLGYPVPPKRLQHLVILRSLMDGESVAGFKSSSIRSAKLCLLDGKIASTAKQAMKKV